MTLISPVCFSSALITELKKNKTDSIKKKAPKFFTKM
jgi:hypothetical protein